MRVLYIAEDGAQFDNEKDCQEHEDDQAMVSVPRSVLIQLINAANPDKPQLSRVALEALTTQAQAITTAAVSVNAEIAKKVL